MKHPKWDMELWNFFNGIVKYPEWVWKIWNRSRSLKFGDTWCMFPFDSVSFRLNPMSSIQLYLICNGADILLCTYVHVYWLSSYWLLSCMPNLYKFCLFLYHVYLYYFLMHNNNIRNICAVDYCYQKITIKQLKLWRKKNWFLFQNMPWISWINKEYFIWHLCIIVLLFLFVNEALQNIEAQPLSEKKTTRSSHNAFLQFHFSVFRGYVVQYELCVKNNSEFSVRMTDASTTVKEPHCRMHQLWDAGVLQILLHTKNLTTIVVRKRRFGVLLSQKQRRPLGYWQ